MPTSQVEKKIVRQAVAAATLGGIGIGILTLPKNATQQQKIAHMAKYTAAGLAAGFWIGKIQKDKYGRAVRETGRLGEMVRGARQYNAEVRAYNRRLSAEIRRLRSLERSERAAQAASRKRAAQRSLINVNSTINTRNKALKSIPAANSGELRSTVSELETRKRELQGSIRSLENLEGVS